MTRPEQATNGEEPRVVVRDRRRIDPATGAVRTPDSAGPRHATPDKPEPSGPAGAVSTQAGPADRAAAAGGEGDGELHAQLAERTSDLQRITAEYANYRRRVERDREAVVVAAKATVVAELLPVLDDIERARAHGDLTGALKAVADKLTITLERAGLTPFGSEGDEFDPAVHQAVQHTTSPDVAGPTVTAVLRRGYQLGERLLRTAMVAVTDHEPVPPEPSAEPVSPVESAAESPVEPGVGAQPGAEPGPPSGRDAGVEPDQEPPLQAGPAVDHHPVHRHQG